MTARGDNDAETAIAGLGAARLAGRPNLPRLALTKQEAAKALGISVDHFERHVLPDIRVIRTGRGQRKLMLVPMRELERWVDEHAAYALGFTT